MIKEAIYRAKPANDAAKHVLFGLTASAIVLVAAAKLTPVLSGVVWLVAFAFIVSALYVYNKYVGAEYCYEIAEYGVPTLVVSLTVGKTSKTMARIDVDSITEIKRMTREEFRRYKTPKAVVKYTYYPTMFPSEVYLISMRTPQENADIFVEVSADFALTLREIAESEREIIDPFTE